MYQYIASVRDIIHCCLFETPCGILSVRSPALFSRNQGEMTAAAMPTVTDQTVLRLDSAMMNRVALWWVSPQAGHHRYDRL